VRKSVWLKLLILAVVILGTGAYIMLHLGGFLVVDRPEKSDIIVVLAGDHNDTRYWHGLDMLRAGYGRHMMIDVSAGKIYGRAFTQYAADFVAQSAGNMKSQISLCTIQNDSTAQESADVARCLTQMYPESRSVLIVTSDFHTRRALLIFRSRIAKYHWSVAAAKDPSTFGSPWWHHREWAKVYFLEGQKLVWWFLFESWRK
jgi:uncharacterized SAM-binding protein YcdF (DUF218 family)